MLTFSSYIKEVAEPLAGDEKRFKEKHTFVKHKELAGDSTNDDKLFNASNVEKTKRHADRQASDESVYEEKKELKGKQHKIDANKNGEIDAEDFKLLRKEDIDPNATTTDATEFSDPKPEIADAASKMPENELNKVLHKEEKKHVSMSSAIKNVLGK